MTGVEVTNRSTRQGQIRSNMASTDTESNKVASSKPSLAEIVTVSSLANMASERVLVRKFRKVGKLQKLDEHYCGPYRILRILGVVGCLENLATGRKIQVHTDRIKPSRNISLDEAVNINDGCIFTATERSSNSTDTKKSMMALNDRVGFLNDNSSPVKQIETTVGSLVKPKADGRKADSAKNPVNSSDKNKHFGLTCNFCKKRNHIALNCKLRIEKDIVASNDDKMGSKPDVKDISSTGSIKKRGEDVRSGPVKCFKCGGQYHIAKYCLKGVDLKDADF